MKQNFIIVPLVLCMLVVSCGDEESLQSACQFSAQIPKRTWRLTHTQYFNALSDLLGEPFPVQDLGGSPDSGGLSNFGSCRWKVGSSESI